MRCRSRLDGFALAGLVLAVLGSCTLDEIDLGEGAGGVVGCGDGVIDRNRGESCDDNNPSDGDGCSSTCAVEEGFSCVGAPSTCEPSTCGDGVLDATEACDQGDVEAGDGCDAQCQIEAGWNCFGVYVACEPVCGDGAVVGRETCDDGNAVGGDGCSAACLVEVPAECGNGAVEGGEDCDDGNTEDGDGCSSTCTDESAECGNGAMEGDEECDDGNTDDDDGCSARCGLEPAVCGDGFVHPDEECDDAGVDPSDGCDESCFVELGWVCRGTPSVCVQSCGNGMLDAGEECDDDNLDPRDGCDGLCFEEPGYSCSGEPSVCEASCGNGVIDGAEDCDDGDRGDGDGCDSSCNVEPGWTCDDAEPTVCEFVACGDDGLEDNDEIGTASAAPEGVDLGVLQICAGDEDWFLTDAVLGTITVDVTFIHANGNLDAELYSSVSMGVVATSTSLDDDEQLVYEALAPGEPLLVRVFGVDDMAENAYQVSYVIAPP
jgi:cysteine-rich repeat protein